VRDEAMKAAIEREIRGIEGVIDVINELEIAGPSSYTSRSSDTFITTKVKASLVDAKDISANSYQVVTERGVVYLQGRVTQREGQIGADIARGVSGVTKVVKVFEYITEEEWKSYQPKPAGSQ
jgi:osmotically-inducible protein OsmY